MSTSAHPVFADLLRERMRGILELRDPEVAALQSHYELLARWNKSLNLTTITDLAEVVERHYCESLFLAAQLPTRAMKVVDIGSGPGFPGFPVGVVRQDCEVVLVESHQRKAVFLKEAARGLRNIRVLGVRAERVENGFDFSISRAVSYQDLIASLPRLASSVALLTGLDNPPQAMGFDWKPAIALPWGTQRYLRIGQRAVSRET